MKDEFPLNQTLTNRLAGNLSRLTVQAAQNPTGRAAAVAVAVTDAGLGSGLPGMPQYEDWQDTAALILTKRSRNLRRHPGQWALPGGRIDDGETAEQAALRELSEEVGLHLSSDAVIGRLDDIVTKSGFIMTPIVVLAGPARDMQPNPGEVDRIHRIPFSELMRPDAPMLEPTSDNPHPDLKMPVGQSWIAAPTAAVMYQFREVCILGRDTRTAHFGQPKFTWK
ncbi:MAG: CoA pyrophosphatase [Burkholderiaceae bacterium]